MIKRLSVYYWAKMQLFFFFIKYKISWRKGFSSIFAVVLKESNIAKDKKYICVINNIVKDIF